MNPCASDTWKNYGTIDKYIYLHEVASIKLHCVISLHAVPNPVISMSGPIQGAMVGSPQIISCTVSTVSGVAASLVMISWTGPRGDPIVNDGRMVINPTISSNNNHTSNLQFAYLREDDNGRYTCNVTIMRTNATRAQSIDIGNFIGEYI